MYTELIKGIFCQNIAAFSQSVSLFICFISFDREIKALLDVSHILCIVLKHVTFLCFVLLILLLCAGSLEGTAVDRYSGWADMDLLVTEC